MNELHIVAVLYAKHGQEEQLCADLTAVVAPSQLEEGSLRYELFRDKRDARRFVFLEHWADSASQEKHHTEGKHILHFQSHGVSAVEKIEVYRLDRIA
ncbi:putative quinol monooxygenase [Paraburkholderia sediminicola]|uniref:putative quinol monooxygenase n=1 Tax=Paraburkholderia sediminicola TaxID=458836 RepID=UPI0038BA98FE